MGSRDGAAELLGSLRWVSTSRRATSGQNKVGMQWGQPGQGLFFLLFLSLVLSCALSWRQGRILGVLWVQRCPAWPQPMLQLAVLVGWQGSDLQQRLGNPFNSDPI